MRKFLAILVMSVFAFVGFSTPANAVEVPTQQVSVQDTMTGALKAKKTSVTIHTIRASGKTYRVSSNHMKNFSKVFPKCKSVKQKTCYKTYYIKLPAVKR